MSRFQHVVSNFNSRRYSEYNQYTLISTPRRWGKTTSVGIFVASVLFSVPESWISVYSTGRRASKALSDLVYKFVMVLEETAGYTKTRVIVKNTEELFYAGEVGSDRRQLYSYPATVQERPQQISLCDSLAPSFLTEAPVSKMFFR
jgi:hypothetical protein